MPSSASRVIAAAQALLVCFVWATSFVITKHLYAVGTGPLTLTGLRYGLAGVVLLPLWLRRRGAVEQGGPGRVRLRTVIPLGLAGYAINPVGYNIGLASLNASWVGVLLGVSNTLQVLMWSGVLLREWPARTQLAAIGIGMSGIVLFESPARALGGRAVGPVLAVIASGTGYALWMIGNRRLMRNADPVAVACPSMLAGALPVLITGVATEGLPPLTWPVWLLVAILAVINTAAAFTLWTHTQAVLAAYESAIINNTMTVQIAVLALVFLGDPLGARQWIAIAVVAAATLAVQITGPTRTARPGPLSSRR